jgi:hypothetical protein
MPGGKIPELAEYLVAMPSIEVWSLETECVQIGIPGTSSPRFLFGKCQKAMPISTTTKLLFHPQEMDKQPAPVCFAYHTSSNRVVWRVKNEAEVVSLVITRLLPVVVVNCLSNSLPFRPIDVGDVVFFLHVVLFHPLLREFEKYSANGTSGQEARCATPGSWWPGPTFLPLPPTMV